MPKSQSKYIRALTIAGSDNSGGAGIQADLKTFSALGCYGMSVITALTAQNTQGVRGIQDLPPAFIAQQIETILEDVGVDAITVHPRTRTQQFTGLSKWDMITQVVDAVNIPITGNGDVKSMADARRMAAETGVESVMIGRGAMGKPWVFDESFEDLSDQEKYEYQTRVVNRHTELIVELFPENVGLIQMQKHLSWYAGGRDRVRAFRVELFGANSYEETRDVFDRYWASVDPSTSEQPNMAVV